MASSPSRLGTAAGTESQVPWREGSREGVGAPRNGKGEKRGREKPPWPAGPRPHRRPPPSPHSLTHSHARVAAAASSPELAPTPAPTRRPGPRKGMTEASTGHIRLTIGERNYRAYGNHGLGLLLLNSELSPAASLLCPTPPQRRTDRRRRPHSASALVRGILGDVVLTPRANPTPTPGLAQGPRGADFWGEGVGFPRGTTSPALSQAMVTRTRCGAATRWRKSASPARGGVGERDQIE